MKEKLRRKVDSVIIADSREVPVILDINIEIITYYSLINDFLSEDKDEI